MCDMAKPYPTRKTPEGEREVEVFDIATILLRLENGASGHIARQPHRLGPQGPHRHPDFRRARARSSTTRSG